MTEDPDAKLISLLRELNAPLEPETTGETPHLPEIDGIRAVIFDIYGTLFVSASGDISLAQAVERQSAMEAAVTAAGLQPPPEPTLTDRFHTAITAAHDRRRNEGIACPEVDIREIWATVLDGGEPPESPRIAELAVRYEAAVNPVWPMPGLAALLDELRGNGLRLGIVSNAQFFTPLLFPALLAKPRADLGFAPELEVWSYGEREAKPSVALYEKLAAQLKRAEIPPGAVLYVGNDLRNDIWPAQAVGFKTALFAGDKRSLRWRRDDERLRKVEPDAVVTDLDQVAGLLEA